MDQLRQYCAAHRSLEDSKREEKSRSSDAKEKRSFAMEALGKGMVDAECCQTVVGGDTYYVCAKYTKRARKLTPDEVLSKVAKLDLASTPEATAEALCSHFQSFSRAGVSVSKKKKSESDPQPLPACLLPHVEAVVSSDLALSTIRKSMSDSRREAKKKCKESKEEAIATLREKAGVVSVTTGNASFNARYEEVDKVRAFSLRDLASTAQRVAMQCDSAAKLREALKCAVEEAFDNEECSKVERLRYAPA